MQICRFPALLLGFLLVSPSIFAQIPHPKRPSAPLWRVQPPEIPAQRQQPKLSGGRLQVQPRDPAAKPVLPLALKPPAGSRPKIYRTMRDVRNIP